MLQSVVKIWNVSKLDLFVHILYEADKKMKKQRRKEINLWEKDVKILIFIG